MSARLGGPDRGASVREGGPVYDTSRPFPSAITPFPETV